MEDNKEQILFREGNEFVGITKDGEYFEAANYNNRNILRAAGSYIKKLREDLLKANESLKRKD